MSTDASAPKREPVDELDWLKAEIEVSNVNLKGWRDATDALLAEKKRLEAQIEDLRAALRDVISRS